MSDDVSGTGGTNRGQPGQPEQLQYGPPGQPGEPGQPSQPSQPSQHPYGVPGQQGQPQYGQVPEYGQPQYGQPQYGQPQYGQPQYGQPQYGQPQYGQPQYGQPQYGQPPNGQPPNGQPQYGQPPNGQAQYGQPMPYPGSVPVAPQPKRSAKKFLIIGAAVIVGLLVIGAIATALNGGAGVKDKGKYTISTPATIGSFAKIDSAATEAAQAQVRTSLSGVGLLRSGQQAKFEFYGTAGSPVPSFGLIGFDKENSRYPGHSPQSTLKAFFKGATVTNQVDKPAGPLGGTLQCGTTGSATSVQRPICGWADGSSLVGVIFVSDTTVDAAAATTLTVRNAVEH